MSSLCFFVVVMLNKLSPVIMAIITFSVVYFCCLHDSIECIEKMWNEVKSSNPSMGVCEVSAAIGQLWRGLGPEEKQRHNHDYTLDKVTVA